MCTKPAIGSPTPCDPARLAGLEADETDRRAGGAAETRSVELRLRADVPVGAYVSGGLDSSVISSLAKDQLGGRLDTFGIRFEDPRFDETAEQRLMADTLKSRHHEFLCGARRHPGRARRCGLALRNAAAAHRARAAVPAVAPGARNRHQDGADRRGRRRAARGIHDLQGRPDPAFLGAPAGFAPCAPPCCRASTTMSAERTPGRTRCGRTSSATVSPTPRHPVLFASHPLAEHRLDAEAAARRRSGDSLTLDGVMADLRAQMPHRLARLGHAHPRPVHRNSEFPVVLSAVLPGRPGGHGPRRRGALSVPRSGPGRFRAGAAQAAQALGQRGTSSRCGASRPARLPEAIWQRRKQPYRAPIGAAMFGGEGMARFGDVLSESALAGRTFATPRAVTQLLETRGAHAAARRWANAKKWD